MKKLLLLLGIAGTLSVSAQKRVSFPTDVIPGVGVTLPGDPVIVDDNTTNDRDLPPGLAKKRDGAKSARDYAPGHRKNKFKHKKHDDEDNNIFGNGRGKKDKKIKENKRNNDNALGGIFGQGRGEEEDDRD